MPLGLSGLERLGLARVVRAGAWVQAWAELGRGEQAFHAMVL